MSQNSLAFKNFPILTASQRTSSQGESPYLVSLNSQKTCLKSAKFPQITTRSLDLLALYNRPAICKICSKSDLKNKQGFNVHFGLMHQVI